MSENQQDMYGTLTEEQKAAQIPYYVHEGEMNRMDRLNKRGFIAFLIVLVMLFVTNAGWIIYENQFQDEIITETYTATTDQGGTAIAHGEGDLNYYGDSDLYQNDQAPGEKR